MLTKKKLGLIFLCMLAAITLAIPVLADVPGQINYQGQLTDDLGVPVPDGTYTMQFHLFETETGVDELWNSPNGEEQVVTVTGGIYTVQLGAVEPLYSSIFDGGTAWLEVVVEGEKLSPRQQVTATAYALKAGDADTLEGSASSAFASAGHAHDSDYVNEGQANSVSSAMITTGVVNSSDIEDNSLTFEDILDGPDSKLNADVLDGFDSSSFFILNQNETIMGRPVLTEVPQGAHHPFTLTAQTWLRI